MNRLSFALVLAIGLAPIAHPAAAAPLSAPDRANVQSATVLASRPIAVTAFTTANDDRAQVLNQIAQSIPAASTRAPKSFDPFDLLTHPGDALKQLTTAPQEQPAPPIEPLDFFKVPPLDSGVSVTVDHF